MNNNLTHNEIGMLLKLVCKEQTDKVIKENGYFLSRDYFELEKLKSKLKRMKGDK